MKLDGTKKFAILKNGIAKGSKVKKVCKQVRDQRNGAQVLLENELKQLTAQQPNNHNQNRDSKCIRIYFHFLITLGHHFFDP